MANETFNPNGYTKQKIADTLRDATNDHLTVEQHTSLIQLLASQIGNGLKKLQENTLDILTQIIYKGSANKLHLENATLTVPSVSGVSASMESGVITVRKTQETADDVTLTLTGIEVAAGTYFLSTGDTLDSKDEIFLMYIYDDNDDLQAVISNTDDIVGHALTLNSAITNGKIEITIDKDYASYVYFNVTPVFSVSIFDKAFALPNFPSLLEVNSNA